MFQEQILCFLTSKAEECGLSVPFGDKTSGRHSVVLRFSESELSVVLGLKSPKDRER